MRRNWKLVVSFTLIMIGAASLGLPGIAQGDDEVTYTSVKISDLEEIYSDGSSAYDATDPVQFVGVVINKPSDMLNYTYDASSNSEPEFQVFVQALPEGTYGGHYVADGDYQGTAVYMGMYPPWGNPPSPLYSESEWVAEMTRIGASTLNYGDVVLIQAKVPGAPYNGKYNINEKHNNSPANDFSITVIDQVTPTASSITMSDLKDTSDNFIFDYTRATGCERYQGSLVQLDNLLLEDSGNWGLDKTVSVSQNGLTFSMLLGLDNDLLSIDADSLTSRPFSVTAILDQESNNSQTGYRLWLTDAANLTLTEVPEPGTLALLIAGALMGTLIWRRAGVAKD